MEGEEEELIIENEYESGVEMDEDEMKEVNFIVQSETGKCALFLCRIFAVYLYNLKVNLNLLNHNLLGQLERMKKQV